MDMVTQAVGSAKQEQLLEALYDMKVCLHIAGA
jgi:hypothetical protein